MQLLFKHIRQLVGSDNPVLDHVASYYFKQPGKHFRPLVVYLVGAATQRTGVPCEGQASRVHLLCRCFSIVIACDTCALLLTLRLTLLLTLRLLHCCSHCGCRRALRK